MAGVARHEYKQGWKFLTLWEGYGASEAAWETMCAFIQPDRSINPFFPSYLAQNNEGQLPIRAETLSQRKKKYSSPCAYVFIVPNRTEKVASFRTRWYTLDILPSVGSLLRATPAGVSAPSQVHFPLTEKSNTGDHQNTTRPLILFAAQWSVSPIAPASHHAIILHSLLPRTRPRAGRGTRGVRSLRAANLHMTTPAAGHLNTPAYANTFPRFGTQSSAPLLANPSAF